MTLLNVKWPPTRGSKGHGLNHLVSKYSRFFVSGGRPSFLLPSSQTQNQMVHPWLELLETLLDSWERDGDIWYGINQWIFQVPVKGGIGGIVHSPIGRYVIPLIYHLYIAFWVALYNPDPTFYGNQKQPLNVIDANVNEDKGIWIWI